MERRASRSVKTLSAGTLGSLGRSFSRHLKSSTSFGFEDDTRDGVVGPGETPPTPLSAQQKARNRRSQLIMSHGPSLMSTKKPRSASISLWLGSGQKSEAVEEDEQACKEKCVPTFQKPENVWKHKEFELNKNDKKEQLTFLGVVSNLLVVNDPYRHSITRSKRSNSEPFLYSWDYGNINVDVKGVPGIVHAYLETKWKEGEKVGKTSSLIRLTKKMQANSKRDDKNGLVIREEPLEILGGSLPQLIDALANHDTADKAYIDIFLATHVSFMSSVDLLSTLIERFKTPTIAMAMSAEETATYGNMIRVRLLNVFKKWLSAYHYDFEEGPLHQMMGAMIKELLDESIATQEQIEWGGFIKRSWNVSKLRDFATDEEIPPPILKKIATMTVENLTFPDFDCLELARQVALVHQSLCTSIRPIHLVEWSKGKESVDSPIHQLNVFSSQLQGWVVTQLMLHDVRKKRITVLTRLIKFCYKLLELNDFNGAMDVYVGLSGYTSQKLWLTWKEKDVKWKQLEELMSPVGSFSALRMRMKNARAPYTIPPAMFIRDLVTINENDDYWDDEKTMVNFHKRRLLASVIFQFQESTREPYALKEVPKIQEYLKNLKVLSQDALEERAAELDPKDKKGKK